MGVELEVWEQVGVIHFLYRLFTRILWLIGREIRRPEPEAKAEVLERSKSKGLTLKLR